MKYKIKPTNKYITADDCLQQKGYGHTNKGLSVYAVRKNKRETVLSVAGADKYELSWLQKPLNTHLGLWGKNANKK